MKAHLTLTLALLLVCTSAVLAQTPDGETPAEETVCDGESGAAYGLCNAYCEAMDCESDEPHASETACSKVADKFAQITGRDVPCVNACPCGLTVGPDVVTSCSSGSFTDGVLLNLRSGGQFFAGTTDGIQWSCGGRPSPPLTPITPEEGQLCVQVLVQQANNQGVTCP